MHLTSRWYSWSKDTGVILWGIQVTYQQGYCRVDLGFGVFMLSLTIKG